MKKKKLLTMILALTIAIKPIASYATNLFNTTYNSADGAYTAEKVSHPDKGIKETDGIIDFENGESDRGQSYSWAAAGYGDSMYVGTSYGAIEQTLKIIAAQNSIDYSIFKAGIDVLFNGTLYMGDEENNPSGQRRSVLLKVNINNGEVKVIEPAANIGGYRAAIEYKDKLYFAAADSQPYLLEVDPATDTTNVVYKSEKPTGAFVSVGIRGLTVVNDQLVASMIGNNGTYIVSSTNPSEGQDSFKVIGTQEDLLDYPAYHYNDSIFGGAIWDMVAFNNKLYLTVVTGKAGNKQSFAMFCGEENKETGEWTYNLLVGDENDGAEYPYGLGADRSGAANLFVYNNHLYIGGYNDPMIALPSALNMDFEEIYKDLSSPVNLWRMDAEENIEMVIGEANDIFPTVLGNYGSGFGENLNQYIWRMEEFDNKLYVGTFDIGSLAYPLMQFTNGDILHMTPEEIKSQINYIKVLIDLIKDKSNEDKIEESDSNKENEAGNEEEVIVQDDISNNNEESVDLENSDNVIDEIVDNEEVASKEEGNDVIDDSIETLEEVVENELEESLGSLALGLEELEDALELPAYSEVEAYNKKISVIDMYRKIMEEYNEIRDYLPEDMVESLDKLLNEDILNNMTYFIETCKYLSKGQRGFDLYVSEDGVNFNTITKDGFGDPYNHGCRVFSITDSYLSIGTANPFNGTQVWRITDNTRGKIMDSVITNSEVIYDKNQKATENRTVEFNVEFNDNTLKTIQLDYNTLKEGVDFTIEDNNIILSETLLNSLEVGEYSIVFKFSAGARANVKLTVIESVNPEIPVDPEDPTEPEVPVVPEEPSTDDNSGTDGKGEGNLPNTGGVDSNALLALATALTIGGGLCLRKKSKK